MYVFRQSEGCLYPRELVLTKITARWKQVTHEQMDQLKEHYEEEIKKLKEKHRQELKDVKSKSSEKASSLRSQARTLQDKRGC